MKLLLLLLFVFTLLFSHAARRHIMNIYLVFSVSVYTKTSCSYSI